MNRHHSGKSLLPVLVVVLVVLGGGFGAYKYSQKMEADKASAAPDRMLISSAFLNAAEDIQQSTKHWPKSKEDLLDHPKVKALDQGKVKEATYTLEKEDPDGRAHYKFSLDGKSTQAVLIPRAQQMKKPLGNGGFQ